MKFNSAERLWLDELKLVLEQEKDSTALKQLAFIGSKVIQARETRQIIQVVKGNIRKNRKIGIATFEDQ